MVKHTKRDWRMAALVALIILVLGASTLTPGTTTWGDDHAAYINEGIAIKVNRDGSNGSNLGKSSENTL